MQLACPRRLIFPIALCVLCLTGPCLTGPCVLADEPPELATPVETRVAATSVGFSSPTTLRPIDFPRLNDLRGYSVDSYLSPNFNSSTTWWVGGVRLSIIVALLLFWLRGLSLCSRQDPPRQPSRWFIRVFGLGVVGSVVALLAPLYLPLVGLLLVTNVLPFWLYKRARNHASSPAAKLQWREFFTFPVDTSWHDTSVKFEPLLIGEQAAPVIRVIEKSTSVPNSLFDDMGLDKKSSGYQLARSLIAHVVTSNATDLHISTKFNHVIAQQRIDGSISTLVDLPLELGKSVINVFKVMSDLNIADRRRSQDGSFSVDVNERRLSFRVCSQGTEAGQKLSIRILDPAKIFTDFSTLGMTPTIESRLKAAINRPHGLVLIVGATGAGKSTTACAALRTIDPHERNIVSIEDPIEYRIPAVDQIEVNGRAGQTFESVLRSVLRQDADVIFIGEIRDEETARIACRAAMTGQLVLATLHANSAVGGVLRMCELGVDVQNLADSLRAVLSQTLLRKLCLHCRVPYHVDQDALQQLAAKGFHGLDGELFHSPEDDQVPCPHCNGRGFFRRTGVFEWLSITPAIGELIQEKPRASAILALARENGMATLSEEALRLVREGKISLDEFYRTFDTQ